MNKRVNPKPIDYTHAIPKELLDDIYHNESIERADNDLYDLLYIVIGNYIKGHDDIQMVDVIETINLLKYHSCMVFHASKIEYDSEREVESLV